MKPKQIDSSHLSFLCPMRRSDLQPSEEGYYCGKCQKPVFDLSECSWDEVIALQRQRGAICGIVRAVGAASLIALSSCAGTVRPPDTLGPTKVGMIPIPRMDAEGGNDPADAGDPLPGRVE